MTPDRWRQVKDIFSSASVLADDERRVYVAEACRGDANLLAEVESLLAAHAVEDAFVDRPAVAQVSEDLLPAAADPWVGRRVGAYEIVAVLGRGGMGSVYRARRVDAEYDKEVAVKLVARGYEADFVLQRLRAERQILANLEHPNIARLIDGGATDDGSPYLVMEFVDGEPIDRYVEQRALAIRDRLRLFRDVCAAVSYAHQRLVVHRDLKPSNILVTSDGSVKLLDFGIAKLLQPATGEVLPAPTITLLQALTPGYASPEQILGRAITTASDVYSLGVLLYVLLTGRSPYRTELHSAHDAIREVCEAEPVRPSVAAVAASNIRLDRDLDAIVLRALRKEPESRYASVEQLSEDVRHYLDGLPVKARGGRLGYRARKFLRRRRLEIAAAGLVATALIGGTVVSLRQARIASEESQRAERHFGSVRKLADVFMFEVHDAIEQLPGSTEARALLVNTALEYLNTLAAEADEDRELQRELASAYEKVADIQGEAYTANIGEPRAALESYRKASSLLEPIVAADPHDLSAQQSLARAYLEQSKLLLLLGDSANAIATSELAVARFEALAEAQPDAATRRALANGYRTHAYTMDMAGGQGDLGYAFAEKAVAILEDLNVQRPDDLDVAYDLANAYRMAANTVFGEKPLPETMARSAALHRQALATDEDLVAATEGRNTEYVRGMVVSGGSLAYILYHLGDYRGAIDAARGTEPAVAILQSDPNNAQVVVDRANIALHLGYALLGAGELREAAVTLEQNAAALEEIARVSDTLKVQYLLGATASTLGSVHARFADTDSPRAARLDSWRLAGRWYERALPHFERVTASVTLDELDRRPIDEAVEGLARATAEIANLVE